MNEVVAVLGPKGTFTEQAATLMYPNHELMFLEDVKDVFDFVEKAKGWGVAAIENSLEGPVGQTMDSLLKYDVKITGRTTLQINLSLLAQKGKTLKDIRYVLSHPHALGQCKSYLKANLPGALMQPTTSTTEAMSQVLGRGDSAAVGMRQTGESMGLVALADYIQDMESNTMFISIGKTPVEGPKSSIIFSLKDEPGALFSILKLFADKNINLTKIESRRSGTKLGEYVFFIDYQNQQMPAEEQKLLHSKLMERTTFFKDLGNY